MERRKFIATAAASVGLVAANNVANADVAPFGSRRRIRNAPQPILDKNDRDDRAYILIEIFYTENADKRAALVEKFDAKLIPLRKEIGFDRIGVFTLNDELMKNERGGFTEKFENAVVVVQETFSANLLLNYQEKSAKKGVYFNLEDDLDFIDEEAIALRSFASQKQIDVPNTNPERVIQMRTYNSPNYDRNFCKEQMFEDGELDLFRRSGMAPVFFGSALFGSMAPNVTYMLSFPNDEARREGWGKFVGSDEWKTMSKDPKYARTATRIRNLFLKPSPNSEI